MKPWRTLGRSHAASGGELTLNERDGEFSIRIDAWELMSSRKHGSEEAMAEVGCRHARGKTDASVLVAGLGLGYSLRATLDTLPAAAKVTVAEFVPEIVEWNRGPVAHLAGRPLEDPRVELVVGDVKDLMKTRQYGFDAILLDTDNGPRAFTDLSNEALYSPAGLRIAKQALRKNGVLVIWSAGPDVRFEKRMRDTGFQTESVVAAAQGNGKGARHVLFVGSLR